jgi:HEAT repeat protein
METVDKPASRKRFPRASRRVVLSVILLVPAITIVLWSSYHGGRRYHGKTARQWLQNRGLEQNVLQNDLINTLGYDVIPELMNALEQHESILTKTYRNISEWIPFALRRTLPGLSPEALYYSRQNAALWLRVLGPEAVQIYPRLTNLVIKENEFIRTLAFVGQERPETVDLLRILLSNPTTRDEAALCVPFLRTNALSLLPALTNSMFMPGSNVLNEIIALGELGPGASNAIPAIIHFLKNSNTVKNAIIACGKMGPGAVKAVPELCAQLVDSSPGQQVMIVDALLKIGPTAKGALPFLQQLRTEENNLLQLLIALTIGKIEGDESVAIAAIKKGLQATAFPDEPAIAVYLRDRHPLFGAFALNCSHAAAFLAADYPSPQLIPSLTEALAKDDPSLRVLAARALCKTTNSISTFPIIIEALDSGTDFQIYIALDALEHIGLSDDRLKATARRGFSNRRTSLIVRKRLLRLLQRLDPEAASLSLFGDLKNQ